MGHSSPRRCILIGGCAIAYPPYNAAVPLPLVGQATVPASRPDKPVRRISVSASGNRNRNRIYRLPPTAHRPPTSPTPPPSPPAAVKTTKTKTVPAPANPASPSAWAQTASAAGISACPAHVREPLSDREYRKTFVQYAFSVVLREWSETGDDRFGPPVREPAYRFSSAWPRFPAKPHQTDPGPETAPETASCYCAKSLPAPVPDPSPGPGAV